MPVHLMYRAGTITGFADRRIVNCMVHPAQPGNIPAPGEYFIGEPANDLIYGPVAIMVRVGVNPALVQECIRRLPAAGGTVAACIAEMTKQIPGGGGCVAIPGGGGCVAVPGGGGTGCAALPAPGAVFVLASRPIAGQNCLVVTASAGLFEAIAAGGGAAVTVY